jgi:hypothetical protein
MKLTQEEKEARKLARQKAHKQAQVEAKIKEEREQRPVKQLTIALEWKKSRMWGMNPHGSVKVEYMDGDFERSEGFTCSGCGYDKASTVVAQVFNRYLKYKLWSKTIEACKRSDYDWRTKGGAPYGVEARKYTTRDTEVEVEHRYYGGGIGVNCYRDISEFIGGNWEVVASGDSFNVYRWTEK